MALYLFLVIIWSVLLLLILTGTFILLLVYGGWVLVLAVAALGAAVTAIISYVVITNFRRRERDRQPHV